MAAGSQFSVAVWWERGDEGDVASIGKKLRHWHAGFLSGLWGLEVEGERFGSRHGGERWRSAGCLEAHDVCMKERGTGAGRGCEARELRDIGSLAMEVVVRS